MEDREIVSLYLERDESAIQLTADKYGVRLRSLAFGILRDEQSAEECENDTYLEAWNSIPPNEPYGYLYAFLARIARHISLDLCRSRNRLKRSAQLCELSDELEQCLPSPDDCERYADSSVLRDALNSFLAGLDEEKRTVFVRRYWYLDSVSDISKRFALSESKVKTMLFRCRAQLREHLEKEGYTQ